VSKNKEFNWVQGLWWLGIIWLLGALSDRLWFWLDRSIPDWDRADYLNGAINYWEALQIPQWLDATWWRSLWLISPKIPPLTYILTVPFLNNFGLSEDAATLIMLLFSSILLISVYGIGVKLFNVSVGLWAAGLCQLFPGLYKYRLEFLLDYPLTAIVTFSFWLLSVWKFSSPRNSRTSAALPPCPSASSCLSWLYASLFGLSLGLALMVKQTSVFFLFFPLLWVLGETILHRRWIALIQLLMAGCISVLVIFPWYRTNWLLMLTSGKRATIDSAIAEGDPALNTLDAWTYYAKVLPNLISFPLLLIPIVGLIIYFGRIFLEKRQFSYSLTSRSIWLLVFLLGGYFLSSANINKDSRYILPLLPVLSLVLANGLLAWKVSWRNYTSWVTISFASVLMLFNIFPLGQTDLFKAIAPNGQVYPYLGKPYPHQEIVQEIINTNPYLRSTLGVLPSTPEINQHNFSFWGNIYNSQVSGRQVGVKKKQVEQDARSLDWFLTKTGEQGSVPEAQAKIVKRVEQGQDFYLHKSWQLHDNSALKLYHHLQPSIQVKRSPLAQRQKQQDKVKLDRVNVPEKTPPGVPIPVTYHWSGNWQQLQSGLVILTWEQKQFVGANSHASYGRTTFTQGADSGGDEIRGVLGSFSRRKVSSASCFGEVASPKVWRSEYKAPPLPNESPQPLNSFWLQDHAIGMGALNSSRLHKEQFNDTFEVIENTAMFADAKVLPGEYTLTATYLDRHTQKTYPISVPAVSITIDPSATASSAPELDLVTQLRNIAPNLARGVEGLDPIFAQTSRINQYDPKQDYLEQAAQSLSYRLESNRQNTQHSLDWTYAIALSKVLQQDVEGAIESLQKVIEIDSQNSYNYAYLAFVYLYDWRGKPAAEVLDKAIAIDPNIPEIQALKGVAKLMQGNLFDGWKTIAPVIDKL
jgi:4-amino-4-deoxy-L-arabinose transferase-like glycosyltransferase